MTMDGQGSGSGKPAPDAVKHLLRTVGPVLVAGIILALGVLIEEKFLGFFRGMLPRPKIVAASSMGRRTPEDGFWAGEVIRLRLEGAKANRVLWLFDEEEKPAWGPLDRERSFPFEKGAPRGALRDHRVDAFWKNGSKYESAYHVIRVRNVEPGRLKL